MLLSPRQTEYHDDMKYPAFDLTPYACPLTFVHARLIVEELASGEAAALLYDPLRAGNLAASVAALDVVIEVVERTEHPGIHRLLLRKG